MLRLLKEMEKVHGPYVEVHVDVRSYKNWHDCWQYDKITSVDSASCFTADGDGFTKEHSQEHPVVVLNKYE